MFKTLLSLVLVGLLVHGASAAPLLAAHSKAEAQAVEKVKQKVAKIGTGAKARVTVRKKDGAKVKGFISDAGADDFTVRDRDTGQPTTILYADVAKVDDNRGHSTVKNVLIGVGIGAGALLGILLIVFASLND
jgi:hypothetical protein